MMKDLRYLVFAFALWIGASNAMPAQVVVPIALPYGETLGRGEDTYYYSFYLFEPCVLAVWARSAELMENSFYARASVSNTFGYETGAWIGTGFRAMRTVLPAGSHSLVVVKDIDDIFELHVTITYELATSPYETTMIMLGGDAKTVKFTLMTESLINVNILPADVASYRMSSDDYSMPIVQHLIDSEGNDYYDYNNKALPAGTYYLLLDNLTGESYSFNLQFNVVPVSSSYPNVSDANTLVVYPNPASDFVTIEGLQVGETLQIYGVEGNMILSFNAVQEKETVEIAHLPSGMYFVKANDQIAKMIKK